MLAAMVMGAEGAQMGSRFVASEEASSNIEFKKVVINSKEGDTILALKQLAPVRMIKNKFYQKDSRSRIKRCHNRRVENIIRKGKGEKGMFEGNLEEGELEIGQVSAISRNYCQRQK